MPVEYIIIGRILYLQIIPTLIIAAPRLFFIVWILCLQRKRRKLYNAGIIHKGKSNTVNDFIKQYMALKKQNISVAIIKGVPLNNLYLLILS
ncbi:MAG: hypothetical protein J5517_10635 [Eubacterium sp.]|nr:hypothetical protein [Eubacterium sp.]